jgi:hypothetical protein
MPVQGWEPVVRTRQPGSSAVVLVREGSSSISDLALLGAGPRRSAKPFRAVTPMAFVTSCCAT